MSDVSGNNAPGHNNAPGRNNADEGVGYLTKIVRKIMGSMKKSQFHARCRVIFIAIHMVVSCNSNIVHHHLEELVQESHRILTNKKRSCNFLIYRNKKLYSKLCNPPLGQALEDPYTVDDNFILFLNARAFRLCFKRRIMSIPVLDRDLTLLNTPTPKEFVKLQQKIKFPGQYKEKYSLSYSGQNLRITSKRASSNCKAFSYYKAYNNASDFLWTFSLDTAASRRELMNQEVLLRERLDEMRQFEDQNPRNWYEKFESVLSKNRCLYGFLNQYIKCIHSRNNWTRKWKELQAISEPDKFKFSRPGVFLLPVEMA